MDRKNSVYDSETPKSILSAESSINAVSFSLGNLSLSNGDGSSSVGSTISLGFNGDFSASGTQETGPDVQETGLDKSTNSVPTPLHPGSIRAIDYSINNGGNFQLGASCSVPVENGFNINYQESQDDASTVHQDAPLGAQNQESFNNGEGRLEGCNFIMFAMSQVGSKNLQDLLALRDPDLTSQILERVTALECEIPVICYLMVDPQGCNLCSELIESCDDQQQERILEKITRCTDLFVKISCNKHGSRMIEKLIKMFKESSLIGYLTFSLYMGFYELMINKTGSYVVIFCLDRLRVKQNALLYEAVIKHCLHLSTHAIGCVSVNGFIDRIQGLRRQTLLELISDNVLFLSHDPSGNHVVQKVLELENPIYSARIGAILRGHHTRLSLQRWGSYVVEKCLLSQGMVYVVEDLLTCSRSQLLQITKDQFGNYVIQKALTATKKGNTSLHLRLLKSLVLVLGALQSGYGKNVYRLIIDGVPLNEIVSCCM